MKEHLASFKPFVKASENQTEFSIRALILGILLSLLFAVGNAYLGLKIGMTISASIPAAVLSMAILRTFFSKGGNSREQYCPNSCLGWRGTRWRSYLYHSLLCFS